MKLTNLVLHFSDVSTIFYAFYKHCCSVLIESSDPGKEVPTSIGSFGFFSSRGARPTKINVKKFRHGVGSSDKHIFSQK